MSCCPPAPPIKTSDGAGYANAGKESAIQKGESVDCYAQRAGNQSGKQDDATENIPGKIENTSIPVNTSNGSVDVTFKLTSNSPTPATSWTGTFTPALPGPDVTFTSAGVLSGTFPTANHGTKYTAKIEAFNGATLIDSRTFNFSPSTDSGTDAIKMVSPLPGGIVNSKFGPRQHPLTGEQKMHTGIDMKMADRSTVDVVSAADGEVVFAGVNGTLTSGYGNCVKIKHSNGSGQQLCTTLYGHLAKIYVAVGQKVSAGQKIGHEGTTGSSTGNHLHFEVRLPNNTPVDPVPYLRGGVTVSDSTTPSGDPSGTSSTSAGNSALTPEEVSARTGDCPADGVNPQTGAVATPPADAATPESGGMTGITDAFENAWYFTMTFEVGPHWMTQPQFTPGDPDLDAGLFDTDLQRKKVGYKPGPNFPGGETKFGVAQNPNKSTVIVKDLTYPKAKTFGRSGYWQKHGTVGKWLDVLLFDITYLHGAGNASKILADAGLTAADKAAGATRDVQLAACEKVTSSALSFISGLNPSYQAGWKRRTNDRLAFVKSLSTLT